MNISVCITVLNEEGSIAPLLESLLNQSKRPDEIVVVDGGSRDKTVEIIKHFQKKDKRVKLLIEKSSRAKGRNLSIETSQNKIIAMTDAGCVPQKDWLEKITHPFNNPEIDVAAGFYKMVYKNTFEKAESFFLGTKPNKFNINFLPSTRSIAFRKDAWEKVGGFPESLEGAAEDTVFNYKLIKVKAKISRVKDAIVEWGMPISLKEFFFKVFNYAEGDAKSKIWVFPKKGLMSHNIKAIFILLRYLIGLFLLVYCFKATSLFPVLIVLIFSYLFWAYRKAGLWGVVLQIVSDIGVMCGFLIGRADSGKLFHLKKKMA